MSVRARYWEIRDRVLVPGTDTRKIYDKVVGTVKAAVQPRRSLTVEAKLAPLLGEFAWHSLTIDPTIDAISSAHFAEIERIVREHVPHSFGDLRILEVAAYAHTTGYQIHQKLGASVDLFDISASTLRLGRRIAQEKGLPVDGARLVTGDFHDLPYEDGQFDLVYICSALHHTWNWQQVLSEMMRVLAPGGILFLENEPIKRSFCFYKFRTNRPDSFTRFEKKLEELGIIRTIAEPYLGSRPEQLFGMVENQTIPLEDILTMVRSSCSILEERIQPEACMSRLDHDIVERRYDSGDFASWLTATVLHLTQQAQQHLLDSDRGLGFGLPSQGEIETICNKIAPTVTSLPQDSGSPEFKTQIARLFGAPLQVLARKHGMRRYIGPVRYKRSYVETEGVLIALRPEVSRLLDSSEFLLPDIQKSSSAEIEPAFPAAQWNLVVSPNDIRELVPAVRAPNIHILVRRPGSLQLLLRIYVVYGGHPYRAVVRRNGVELTGFSVFQAESTLLSCAIPCSPGASKVTVSLHGESFDSTDVSPEFIRITYAGAFPLG